MIEITLMSFETYTIENLMLEYTEFTQSCVLLQIFVQVLFFYQIYFINNFPS